MGQALAIIIDDNSKNLSILARLLRTEGITSIQLTHSSGLEAALEQAENLAVVFLDLELPGDDGFTLLSRLKSDPRTQSVPVIAYTVHVSEINVAHRHGFDGFIGKPLDSEKFPEQLERILRGEPVWETP
jgi:two-component system cell cycle response regulator DivK